MKQSQSLYSTESGETLFNQTPELTFQELTPTDRQQALENQEAVIEAARQKLSE